jgi:oligosaccharide repeat unit polymerase
MTAEHLNAKNSFRNTLLFGAAAVLMLAANFLTVFGGFYYESAACTMFAANLVLNVAILFDLCVNIRRDFPLLVFVGSFDLLLLGRVYVAFFSDYQDILYDLEADDFENLFGALRIVTLSLLCVYTAYRLAAPLFSGKEKAVREKGWAAVRQNPLVPVIRQISVVILLISSIPFFFMLFQTILNVFKYGYLGSFTQKADANIPSVISRLSMFFTPSFAVFLATLPNRRQLKFPLFVYGVYMLASLLTGRRNTFVCEALMIVIYFVLRDSLRSKENRRIKKRAILWAVIVCAVLMYLLELIAEFRAGYSVSKKGLFSSLVTFIQTQGASFRVIIQTVNRWDQFDHPTAYRYLFYPFEQFVHNNVITRSVFSLSPIVEVQTTAFAQTTHNFAHALTYLVDPARYLSGGGFGTSYVAEAYVAFGMGGVIAVSAMVGVAFRFFSSMLTRSWVVTACCLIALKDFVYIPRNFAFSWVTDVFNITYLCFYIGIYLAAMLFVKLGAHVRGTQAPAVPLQPEEEP